MYNTYKKSRNKIYNTMYSLATNNIYRPKLNKKRVQIMKLTLGTKKEAVSSSTSPFSKASSSYASNLCE